MQRRMSNAMSSFVRRSLRPVMVLTGRPCLATSSHSALCSPRRLPARSSRSATLTRMRLATSTLVQPAGVPVWHSLLASSPSFSQRALYSSIFLSSGERSNSSSATLSGESGFEDEVGDDCRRIRFGVKGADGFAVVVIMSARRRLRALASASACRALASAACARCVTTSASISCFVRLVRPPICLLIGRPRWSTIARSSAGVAVVSQSPVGASIAARMSLIMSIFVRPLVASEVEQAVANDFRDSSSASVRVSRVSRCSGVSMMSILYGVFAVWCSRTGPP
mmetsp:Transcript_41358/g.95535  ORF Transcript_41358/g.95535 Transcript_41358/m.95535 type:complete len:282 (+) Transcript_41358:649-1494(+)